MADTALPPGTPSSGQAPPGAPPPTMPVPNRGLEAQALAQLSVVVNALLNLIPKFGVGTDIGKALLDTTKKLSTFVPPGSTSQGVQNNQMMEMMRQQQASQPMAALMAARPGAGAPPAAPMPNMGAQA